MPDLNNEKEYAHVCEISISLDKLRIACSNRWAGKYRDDVDIIAMAERSQPGGPAPLRAVSADGVAGLGGTRRFSMRMDGQSPGVPVYTVAGDLLVREHRAWTTRLRCPAGECDSRGVA
ncbi:hypothetical protein [Burkholderia cepacia]|uniref:hypothetical protein n=1 Tax=Burkholderia cepacia TaxID=292 RepID=UPI0012D8CBF1|nr:hypothetical protein [Burkholderia cepacia]